MKARAKPFAGTAGSRINRNAQPSARYRAERLRGGGSRGNIAGKGESGGSSLGQAQRTGWAGRRLRDSEAAAGWGWAMMVGWSKAVVSAGAGSHWQQVSGVVVVGSTVAGWGWAVAGFSSAVAAGWDLHGGDGLTL